MVSLPGLLPAPDLALVKGGPAAKSETTCTHSCTCHRVLQPNLAFLYLFLFLCMSVGTAA